MDLSSNGISFETEREYQKGALILLEVYLPEEALKLLVCVAWVKRLEGDLFQVGAELVAVDPVHKRKMQSHLKKMIQTFATKRVSAKKRRPKKPALKKKKSSKKKISKKKVAKKKVTTKRRS